MPDAAAGDFLADGNNPGMPVKKLLVQSLLQIAEAFVYSPTIRGHHFDGLLASAASSLSGRAGNANRNRDLHRYAEKLRRIVRLIDTDGDNGNSLFNFPLIPATAKQTRSQD